MLDASLSPCSRYHPAEVAVALASWLKVDPAFVLQVRTRPSDLHFSRLPVRSLSLQPGDSLTTLTVALSVGITSLAFPPTCYSSYDAAGFCIGGPDPR